MRSTFYKLSGTALITLFVLGCSSNNKVKRIEQHTSVIKYSERYTDEQRFENLYNDKKIYPLTCADDCYPSSPVVECESPAENCQFTGKNSPIELDIGFTVQWLGHASFDIETSSGTQVLIDPVSEQFDWPVDLAFRLSNGFYRNEPLWPSNERIENTSAVLYSHIHYDHFNKSDIERIGNKTNYLVPLGFAEHFPTGGFKISEMSWYSAKTIDDVSFNFVPAHHFSSRIWVPYLYEDNDKTLWGGWVIEHQNKQLFFAGDTGYSKHFQDIHQKYGDMDVCLIPIASYFHETRGKWYRFVHTTPEDALVAAEELNCKVMIPWGYGNNSWKMGDKSSHSPLLRLLKMHKEMKSPIKLHILNEGETLKL